MHALPSYQFDWGFIGTQLPALASGLKLTVIVSAIGIGGAVLVGLAGGTARAYHVPVASQFTNCYVEIVRNTPLLVQIFFLFFVFPYIGLKFSAFNVGWLALVIWGGAYNVENFRAGFEAIPDGYLEAGRALGLTGTQAFAAVSLPLGVRIALPSSINTAISVLKNSSFLVAISLPELTTTAVNIVSVTFRVFEMFFAIAVIYLFLVFLVSAGIRAYERHLAIPGVAA